MRIPAVALAVAAVALGELGTPGDPARPSAPDPRAARATQVLTAFLGVAKEDLQVTTVRVRQGSDHEPALVAFEECRVRAPAGETERVRAKVDAVGWYVASVSWPDRGPAIEIPIGAEPCARPRIEAAATAFARAHFPQWSHTGPRRMRLEAFAQMAGRGHPTAYNLMWKEQAGEWYTGSLVSVTVSTWAEPQVLSYSARIAPAHSRSEVKMSRRRALAIATWIGDRVAGEPVTLIRTVGSLSHPLVPGRGPGWDVYLETKRRIDDHPVAQFAVIIDAVTGADVTWALLPQDVPPDWPKPEDMPPDLRPTAPEASQPSAEPP